jgi:nitrite reductase (NO-forming)
MGRMDLPMARPGQATETACCEACGREAAAQAPSRHDARVLEARAPARQAGRTVIRRDTDRRITTASVAVAALFLLLAVAAVVVPALSNRPVPVWLPLHLVLAGGAATAIAGVLPFFTAALGAAPPAPAVLRVAAVALVATGAAAVSARAVVPPAWSSLPLVGGILFLGGVAALSAVTVITLRRGLAVRRPLVAAAYLVALLDVAAGAALGTLAVGGFGPVQGDWATLRVAHAWLNLMGFVSLVVAGTLLHLLPTVLGTRIVPRRSAAVAVAGLALGAPLGAVGLTLAGTAADPLPGLLARAGALLTAVGALGLGAEAIAVVRRRGRWSSDAGWHAVAQGSLLAGIAWFVAGTWIAVLVVLVHGASGRAWSTDLVAVPLAVGWVVQVLIGSITHLLPAIGPGGPAGHAARRRVLGSAGPVRVVSLNVGALLLFAGAIGGSDLLTMVGAGAVLGTVLATLGLVALSMRPAVPHAVSALL